MLLLYIYIELPVIVVVILLLLLLLLLLLAGRFVVSCMRTSQCVYRTTMFYNTISVTQRVKVCYALPSTADSIQGASESNRPPS